MIQQEWRGTLGSSLDGDGHGSSLESHDLHGNLKDDEASNAQFGGEIVPPQVVLATAGYDHTVRFWDVVSGVCVSSLQYNLSQVNCLAVSEDKRLLAAGGHPQIHLFDTSSAAGPLRVLESPEGGNVTALGFERDGRWLWSADDAGTVKVWDLRAARCQRDLDNKAPINGAVLHPNQGDILTADQRGSLRFWDLTASACATELIPEETTPLRSVTVTGTGDKVAVVNASGRAFVWRSSLANDNDAVADYVPVAKVQAHDTYVTKAAFSPSADLLATASADHSINIWQFGASPSRKQRASNLSGSEMDIEMMLSDDDDDDDDDNDYEETGETPLLLRDRLEGHLKWVWDCAWSADSAYLVSASSDTTARLWSVSSGECICIYTGHSKALTAVALNDLAI
jgi:G protein beta subunit-like protein